MDQGHFGSSFSGVPPCLDSHSSFLRPIATGPKRGPLYGLNSYQNPRQVTNRKVAGSTERYNSYQNPRLVTNRKVGTIFFKENINN